MRTSEGVFQDLYQELNRKFGQVCDLHYVPAKPLLKGWPYPYYWAIDSRSIIISYRDKPYSDFKFNIRDCEKFFIVDALFSGHIEEYGIFHKIDKSWTRSIKDRPSFMYIRQFPESYETLESTFKILEKLFRKVLMPVSVKFILESKLYE